MIDLHTHILPGLDDGARDMAASLTMGEVAVANGIHTLVATPHIREDFPDVEPSEIPALARAVQDEMNDQGIAVRILPGGELALSRALDMSDGELRAVTLAGNGRDLLLETPHEALPSIFEDAIADLQRRRFRITLAHPELNPDLRRAPRRLGALVERGVLVQITADSLGTWRARGRFCRSALRSGHVHVVASDAHATEWRPPDLGPARGLGALGRWLTDDAPAALLAGLALPARPER